MGNPPRVPERIMRFDHELEDRATAKPKKDKTEDYIIHEENAGRRVPLNVRGDAPYVKLDGLAPYYMDEHGLWRQLGKGTSCGGDRAGMLNALWGDYTLGKHEFVTGTAEDHKL